MGLSAAALAEGMEDVGRGGVALSGHDGNLEAVDRPNARSTSSRACHRSPSASAILALTSQARACQVRSAVAQAFATNSSASSRARSSSLLDKQREASVDDLERPLAAAPRQRVGHLHRALTSTSTSPCSAARSRRSITVSPSVGANSPRWTPMSASRTPTSTFTRSRGGTLAAGVRACSRLAFARSVAP